MLVPKTVLIADDNPQIRSLLCRMFEAEAHYDLCAEAKDVDEAILLALKHRPDLIVLDLVMPKLNGIQAAKKLKELLPETPITLFTQPGDVTPFVGNISVDRVVSKTETRSLMDHIRELARRLTDSLLIDRRPRLETSALPTPGSSFAREPTHEPNVGRFADYVPNRTDD